ncbi:MAG: ThaI family type II restriction endonuclease, partial [Thiomargarita sp.]|nr:ThaI family type II restriction endonuclease [Thiomargarita sp.]
WNQKGGIYFLTKEAQKEVLQEYGKDFYFKLPKKGTNPRGIEITNKAINKLVEHNSTKKIEINWIRSNSIKYNSYDKWVEHWKNDKNT